MLFSIPIVVYLALSSGDIASPSPDLTVSLLQLIMFVLLVRSVGQWVRGKRDQDDMAALLVMLAVTSLTVKLSSFAFSSVIIGFVLLYVWKHHAAGVVGRVVALCALLLAVWFARGMVLSGVPLFPSTIGHFPFEWAMPKKKIINEANWIFSWARQPGIHWKHVLGNWNWFEPWLLRVSQSFQVVFPMAVSATLWLATAMLGGFNKKCRRPFLEWAVLLPPLAALAFWFFSAPAPRFAMAFFQIQSLGAILLFLSALQSVRGKRFFLSMAIMICFAGNLHIGRYVKKYRWVSQPISVSGFHPVRKVPLRTKTTLSGLTVYLPKTGDQCWDARLPSTPYFNRNLALRDPEKISSGFMIKRGEKK